jgi:hypothetical protein
VRHPASLITARAVRADARLFATAASFLRGEGRLFLFRPTNTPVMAKGFEYVETVQLSDTPRAYLSILRRVFHVEQSG